MLALKDIGILPAKEKQFNKKGIFEVNDLLSFFPRKYNDFSKKTGLLSDGDLVSCFVMHITKIDYHEPKSKGAPDVLCASGYDVDSRNFVRVTWFRQKYLYNKLTYIVDKDVYVCGKAKYNPSFNVYEIIAPDVFDSNIKDAQRIYPVYSKIAGMSDEYLCGAISKALSKKSEYCEFLPTELVETECLMGYQDAIKQIHQPNSVLSLNKAKERILFDDLLYFSTKLEMQSRMTPKGNAHNVVTMKLFNDVKNELPFTLSDGQEKVINSILQDMKNGKNVRALLSSDVGSGKTVVAMLLSCALAGKTASFNGYQVAWLIPSKALAAQHYEELSSYLNPLGYEVLFLNSSMKKKERDEALYKIKNGLVNFVIGTHSILNDAIEFKDLAFIVCDESHKFGVTARNKLSEKVAGKAHLLTMSGTPIPRTMAMVLSNNGITPYTMERPSGRLPIKTRIYNNRKGIFNFIRQEVGKEHQVYVVCPMIDKNEEKMEGIMSVEEVSEMYEKELSKDGITIATLTGKNKAQETEEIIEKFKNNETNVLIATSVVEVGINIPTASTIIIENAERFGLASLHQLRGRVGRKSGSQGYCILVSNDLQSERLNALVNEQNGFKLSEKDLELRRSGNLIGEMQSGENKYFELMLENKNLYDHISNDIVPTLLDSGEIEQYVEDRYNKENPVIEEEMKINKRKF